MRVVALASSVPWAPTPAYNSAKYARASGAPRRKASRAGSTAACTSRPLRDRAEPVASRRSDGGPPCANSPVVLNEAKDLRRTAEDDTPLVAKDRDRAHLQRSRRRYSGSNERRN